MVTILEICGQAAHTGESERSQLVTVRLTLAGLDGFRVSYPVPVFAAAHRTATVAFDLPVEGFFPIGAYGLTAAASNRHGTSSATASLEIV